MKAWVIVVLVMTSNGKTGQEMVAGDYPTKAACEESMAVLANEADWVLQCVPRKKGMKRHKEYFIGD